MGQQTLGGRLYGWIVVLLLLYIDLCHHFDEYISDFTINLALAVMPRPHFRIFLPALKIYIVISNLHV